MSLPVQNMLRVVLVVEPSHADRRMTIWYFNYEVVQEHFSVLHML